MPGSFRLLFLKLPGLMNEFFRLVPIAVAVLKQLCTDHALLVDQHGPWMRKALLKMKPVLLDRLAARVRQNRERHIVAVTELLQNLDRVITDSNNLSAS